MPGEGCAAIICSHPLSRQSKQSLQLPADIGPEKVTRTHFDAIVARMHADRLYWDLVELGAGVLEAAERLILQTPVRTLDALHIASAPVLPMESGAPLPFATADARQREAAAHVGLKVVWVT